MKFHVYKFALLKAPWHVSTWTRKAHHVRKQGMLVHKHISMQGTLAREHVSTQGTLACEHLRYYATFNF